MEFFHRVQGGTIYGSAGLCTHTFNGNGYRSVVGMKSLSCVVKDSCGSICCQNMIDFLELCWGLTVGFTVAQERAWRTKCNPL